MAGLDEEFEAHGELSAVSYELSAQSDYSWGFVTVTLALWSSTVLTKKA